MSRKTTVQPSDLERHCVTSPESQKVIDVVLNLLTSCAGPAGKIHSVRNACGGHVTLTSDCKRLFTAMSITRPELKLIVSSVQAHLQQFGDSGLFMACVCLHLIKSSVALGNHFHSLSRLYEMFAQIISHYLNSSICTVCVEADFKDLKVLLAYVKSNILSKSLLNLRSTDSDRLCELVVRTFVESIPTCPANSDAQLSNQIHIVSIEKRPIRDSRLERGFMVDFPELSVLRGEVELTVKEVSADEDSQTRSCIRVALITCSMSGDVEELEGVTFEVTHEQSRRVEDNVTGKIINFCENLEMCDVGIILCQRVIHPAVKAALRSKGILFVDRLGSHSIPYLQDLTGAQPIASVVTSMDVNDQLGKIESVRHIMEGGKSFLHLKHSKSSVITLILCADLEERLSELKNCVNSTLQGLYSLSKEPKLLAGGGCWQVQCSYFLNTKIQSELSAFAEKGECSESQVLDALAAFRSSLHHWVISLASGTMDIVVDPYSYHCWRVPKGREITVFFDRETYPCCCGLKSVSGESLPNFDTLSRNESLHPHTENMLSGKDVCATNSPMSTDIVLDNFSSATQALFRGVSTANLVLSIGQFIINRS